MLSLEACHREFISSRVHGVIVVCSAERLSSVFEGGNLMKKGSAGFHQQSIPINSILFAFIFPGLISSNDDNILNSFGDKH